MVNKPKIFKDISILGLMMIIHMYTFNGRPSKNASTVGSLKDVKIYLLFLTTEALLSEVIFPANFD
jgi:hypothetical protein